MFLAEGSACAYHDQKGTGLRVISAHTHPQGYLTRRPALKMGKVPSQEKMCRGGRGGKFPLPWVSHRLMGAQICATMAQERRSNPVHLKVGLISELERAGGGFIQWRKE